MQDHRPRPHLISLPDLLPLILQQHANLIKRPHHSRLGLQQTIANILVPIPIERPLPMYLSQSQRYAIRSRFQIRYPAYYRHLERIRHIVDHTSQQPHPTHRVQPRWQVPFSP